MFPRKWYGWLLAIGAAYVFLTPARAEQGAGTLSLVIRPEALVSAPASVAAAAATSGTPESAAWTAQFEIPVSVKIRLEKNVAAELLIEPLLSPTEVISGLDSGEVVVGGVSTPFALGAPARITVSKSGVHQMNPGVILRGHGNLSPAPVPIRLTLHSFDGAIHWTNTIQLAWAGLTR